jgi:hypothetical protein
MAKAVKGKSAETHEVDIHPLQRVTGKVRILGKTPLITNRMAAKAMRELLFPRRKTAADKAGNMKHNPVEEYRNSVYSQPGDDRPTRLTIPASAFKGAMLTAALHTSGVNKTGAGRSIKVTGEHLNLYGVPQLFMAIVRSADMNKTPDVRTRAILPRWACEVEIEFVRQDMNETSLVNLVAAAGIVAGVGDFRQEKGKGSFGQFMIVNEGDPEWKEYLDIVATEGREAQDHALEYYECYDADTEELLSWFEEEVTRRGADQGPRGVKTNRGNNRARAELEAAIAAE